ncbi:MAG: tRNA pseudouridine(55) synthase TruB [Bacteroidales bacterium]|jgi:tRNA pseudouridine55 synthase|nr:tRNA pseudouridine(55) synthase TruB [Bacteroidales bacterium]
MDLLLLVDKPYKWTSFDVVNKIRYCLKHATGLKNLKVGHAGTLDPLATGLLLIAVGKFTKQIETLQAHEKEYTGTFVLGQTTDSYDLEKPPVKSGEFAHLTEKDLLKAAAQLTGNIMQIPPVFSAVKIDGKRAYEYARKNREVTIAAKPIEIKEFELTRIALPEIDFRIVCSKGTYIRAIARDFGELLHSGAHLSSLCRTRIGSYHINAAIKYDTANNNFPLDTPNLIKTSL